MKFEQLSQSEIIAIAKPIWDNIISAGNDKNYDEFSRDFSDDMKKNAIKKDIQQQWKKQPLLSDLLPEPEFIGSLHSEKRLRVLWKQKFSTITDEALGHLELIEVNGIVKVDGAQIL